MEHRNANTYHSHGWLDHLAIGMAAVCVVHCLLTPVLVIALPLIATTFFVHEDFHLWMIFLVLPTTGLAIFMGCRKHRDKWVATLSAVGLSLLVFVVAQERVNANEHGGAAHEHHCEICARDAAEEPIPMSASVWVNVVGGLFLASAHFRNFRLCRRSQCSDC